VSGLDDDARLARILPRLDEGDRAWLVNRLDPPWRRRRRRLAARDAAIRTLALEVPFGSGRQMAKAIAAALDRYASSGWRFERDRQPGDPRRALLWRILDLNGRRAPSKATIERALAGVAKSFRICDSAGDRPGPELTICEVGADGLCTQNPEGDAETGRAGGS
jgi:hypothetical protein